MNLALLLATFCLSCLLCMDRKPKCPSFLDCDDLFTRSFLVGIGYNLANIPEFLETLYSTGRSCPRLLNELEELEILKCTGTPGLKLSKEDSYITPEGEDLIVGNYSFLRTLIMWSHKLLNKENDIQERNLLKILQETFASTPELKSLVHACGYEEFGMPFLEFLTNLNMKNDYTDLFRVANNLVDSNASALSFNLFFMLFKGGRKLQESEVIPILYSAQHLISNKTGSLMLHRLAYPLSLREIKEALIKGVSDAFILEALDLKASPDRECVLLALENKRSSDLVKALIRKVAVVDSKCLEIAIAEEYDQEVIDLLKGRVAN